MEATLSPATNLSGSSLQRVMKNLHAKLSEILTSFDTRKPVLYFDYPVHLNVGDLLINIGTEQFFKENKIDVWRRYSIMDFPKMLPRIDSNVTVLCHGGGNFGDIWTDFQKKREAIFEQYANNRIVVLPQTVHFQSTDSAKASVGKLLAHKNHHIYVRDHRSLETLRAAGMTEVSTMPDMAHTLWGILQPTQELQESRALRLMRRDLEAAPLPKEFAQEWKSAESFDWDTIVKPLPRALARLAIALIYREALFHFNVQKHWQWYPIRDMAIRDGVNFFSRYSTIYTNRLHAMILGSLLKKQVIVFDNSYGKLSGYHNAWLSECDNIRFINF